MSTFSNPLTEYSPQMEFGSGQADSESESFELFDEVRELEMMTELLDVANEQQLERFLVDFIREVSTTTGAVAKPNETAALRDVLRQCVNQIRLMKSAQHGRKRTSIGAQLGDGLSATAGQVLGLELEGLSPEDREFEAARQFLRFAGETVKKTVDRSRTEDPSDAADHAAVEAAEVYAPGLFADAADVHGVSGEWIRRGDRIILFGV
jgi:hypothetical protein